MVDPVGIKQPGMEWIGLSRVKLNGGGEGAEPRLGCRTWMAYLPTYKGYCLPRVIDHTHGSINQEWRSTRRDAAHGAGPWTRACYLTHRISKGRSQPYSCKDRVPCPSLHPASNARQFNRCVIITNYCYFFNLRPPFALIVCLPDPNPNTSLTR